jgi:putative addiction module killer protein
MGSMIKLLAYRTEHGVEPFKTFLQGITDPVAKAAVAKALSKMEKGLPGKVESVGDGVKEYKIHVGKGHRIYFYNDGQEVVILLGGSDKKNQDREIINAKQYLKDYKRQKKAAAKKNTGIKY